MVIYSILIILFCSISQAQTTQPKKILNISFEQLDKLFGEKSQLTEIQKDNLWKEYKGKYIIWEGRVDDIIKGWLGMAVHIKYIASTTTQDVSIDFPKERQKILMSLMKGQKIKYKAKLRSRSGNVMPYFLDDGEILDDGVLLNDDKDQFQIDDSAEKKSQLTITIGGRKYVEGLDGEIDYIEMPKGEPLPSNKILEAEKEQAKRAFKEMRARER